ncbi:hypothetical protein TRFO_37951 [Tritrichomonas foetus]|uniref:DH domain-containing protein n=1 Tax=Tritrichomonas foetus TaxID=1144522 RepID=A0A1J4J9Q7_9EUKA|nr:hypothetical protein TRFO_37951 [Tritrichomonas foetus]|eukprot:OHS95926.1 hypothetical protein TRFO_37951 [Tritrichomonas foetus]
MKYVCVRSDAAPSQFIEVDDNIIESLKKCSLVSKANLWIRTVNYSYPIDLNSKNDSLDEIQSLVITRDDSKDCYNQFPAKTCFENVFPCLQIFHSISHDTILFFVNLYYEYKGDDDKNDNLGINLEGEPVTKEKRNSSSQLFVKVPIKFSIHDKHQNFRSFIIPKIQEIVQPKLTIKNVYLTPSNYEINKQSGNNETKNANVTKEFEENWTVDEVLGKLKNYEIRSDFDFVQQTTKEVYDSMKQRVTSLQLIFEKEKKFVDDVDKMVNFWQSRIKDLDIFSNENETPFPLLDKMLNLHTKILEVLTLKQPFRYSTEIGQLFLSIASFFKKESLLYISNTEKYVESVESNCFIDDVNDTFTELANECNGVSFIDYLNRPKTHYLTYYAAIKELKENTPKFHPDYFYLLLSLKELEDISSKITGTVKIEMKRKHDDISYFSQLEEAMKEEEEVPDDLIQKLSEEPAVTSEKREKELLDLEQLIEIEENVDDDEEVAEDGSITTNTSKVDSATQKTPSKVKLQLDFSQLNKGKPESVKTFLNMFSQNADEETLKAQADQYYEELRDHTPRNISTDSEEYIEALIKSSPDMVDTDRLNRSYDFSKYKRNEREPKSARNFSQSSFRLDASKPLTTDSLDEISFAEKFRPRARNTNSNLRNASSYGIASNTGTIPNLNLGGYNRTKPSTQTRATIQTQTDLIPFDSLSFKSLNPEFSDDIHSSRSYSANYNNSMDIPAKRYINAQNSFSTKSGESEGRRPYNYVKYFDQDSERLNTLFKQFYGDESTSSKKSDTASIRSQRPQRVVYLNNTKITPKEDPEESRSVFSPRGSSGARSARSPTASMFKSSPDSPGKIYTPQERQEKIEQYMKMFNNDDDVQFRFLSSNSTLSSPRHSAQRSAQQSPRFSRSNNASFSKQSNKVPRRYSSHLSGQSSNNNSFNISPNTSKGSFNSMQLFNKSQNNSPKSYGTNSGSRNINNQRNDLENEDNDHCDVNSIKSLAKSVLSAGGTRKLPNIEIHSDVEEENEEDKVVTIIVEKDGHKNDRDVQVISFPVPKLPIQSIKDNS